MEVCENDKAWESDISTEPCFNRGCLSDPNNFFGILFPYFNFLLTTRVKLLCSDGGLELL